MSRTFPILLSMALVTACKRDPIGVDSETDTDFDTSTDTDIDTDTDTDTDPDTDPDTGSDVAAPEGFAFCAAGGRVSGSGYSATLCLGPMDAGIGQVQSGGYTWQAGPIFILDP